MASMEKKMAAALAAVSAYMQQEQEVYQDKLAAASAPPQAAMGTLNLWGHSGRQAMAQMRNLMQLKAFHRFR